MQPKLSQTFFLSAGETNPEQEMSLPLLVSKIIDIATAHANSLGIGNPAMTEIRAGWVLSRLTIEMRRWPAVNENYTLNTWIESFNRRFSERDFSVCDENGEVIGYARSIWMVMGVDSHENVGLSHLSLPEDMISGESAPIERQKRHRPILAPAADVASAPSAALIATSEPTVYRFKYCDLDSYRHVNTVRYVDLLLNQFSLEEFDRTAVARLELSFLHEARYGMTVEILRREEEEPDGSAPLLSSFSLTNAEEGTPILFARLLRRPRE